MVSQIKSIELQLNVQCNYGHTNFLLWTLITSGNTDLKFCTFFNLFRNFNLTCILKKMTCRAGKRCTLYKSWFVFYIYSELRPFCFRNHAFMPQFGIFFYFIEKTFQNAENKINGNSHLEKRTFSLSTCEFLKSFSNANILLTNQRWCMNG